MNLDYDFKGPAAAFAIFLLGGLFLGQLSSGITGSTEIACPCTAGNTTQDGPITCNEVTKSDYLFRTGILDIYSETEAHEVVMCDNGEREGVTINDTSDSGYRIASPLLGIR